MTKKLLSELSKKTLGRYVNRAVNDVSARQSKIDSMDTLARAAHAHGWGIGTGADPDVRQHAHALGQAADRSKQNAERKNNARSRGIWKATKKMAEGEETPKTIWDVIAEAPSTVKPETTSGRAFWKFHKVRRTDDPSGNGDEIRRGKGEDGAGLPTHGTDGGPPGQDATGEVMGEDEINELSRKTLGSYVRGAIDDKTNSAVQSSRASLQLKNMERDRRRRGESYRSDKNFYTTIQNIHDKRILKRTRGLTHAVNKLTKEEEQINEAKKISNIARVQDALAQHGGPHFDTIGRNKEGHIIGRRSFFYTHGQTSENLANKTSEALNRAGIKHEIAHHAEHWRPFRGGASVAQGSHFAVHVKLHEDAEQIDELSRKTLGTYVKKAVPDYGHNKANVRQITHGMRYVVGHDKKAARDERNMMNRRVGIERAVDRLQGHYDAKRQSSGKGPRAAARAARFVDTHTYHAESENIDEKVLGRSEYAWHTYKGRNPHHLSYRGKHSVSLHHGDLFGIRHAHSDPHKQRVIVPSRGETIVHSLTHDEAHHLRSKSEMNYGVHQVMRMREGEELDERERTGSYAFTTQNPHHQRIANLRSGVKLYNKARSELLKQPEGSAARDSAKGTFAARVKVRARLGKDNPNADRYRFGGDLHRRSSQDVRPEHGKHHDVYVHNRYEDVEQIDELRAVNKSFTPKQVETHRQVANQEMVRRSNLEARRAQMLAVKKRMQSHSFRGAKGGDPTTVRTAGGEDKARSLAMTKRWGAPKPLDRPEPRSAFHPKEGEPVRHTTIGVSGYRKPGYKGRGLNYAESVRVDEARDHRRESILKKIREGKRGGDKKKEAYHRGLLKQEYRGEKSSVGRKK